MAEIGHSTLLKYFIDTSKMSSKDETIESKVPGEQQLRGASEIAPNDDKDDFVYTPVLNITKEETTWTKGGLKGGVKLQKVVVSDTSDDTTTVNETVTVMESSGPNSIHTEIHTEVCVTRTEDVDGFKDDIEGKTEAEDNKDKKKSTKIPKFKLKQTVDKIKQEEHISQERIVHEPFLGTKLLSTIPRLKDVKPQIDQTDLNKNENYQTNQEQKSPKLDDEFDKLYEEIIEQDVINNNIRTPDKLDELSKVDTKFEEIIHSYEDNKSQTVVTEKVKSKIPLLKRKSEQEIDVPPQLRKNSLKKSVSVEDSKSKIAVAQTKDKTIKTNLERTKIRNNSLSSGHYSTETKSETYSAQAAESVSVTKIVTTQINTTTEEQVSVSSKENVKVEQKIDTNTLKETSASSKDNNKRKIPVFSQSKKKFETKATNNVEKVTEQVTNEIVKTLVVNQSEESHKEDIHSIKKNEIKFENKLDVPQELKSNIHTSTVNQYDNETKLTSNSLVQENKSFDQSSQTSENTSIKILSDNTKVTEITKVNTEIENLVTSEVKETVQVATLKYDASLESEFKLVIDNSVITLNDTGIEESTDKSGEDKVTEITKVTVENDNHVTTAVKEIIHEGTFNNDTSHEFESKSIIDNSKITSNMTVIEGTTLKSDVTTKETTNTYSNAIKTETVTEIKVLTSESLEAHKHLDSSVAITTVSTNNNITIEKSGAENQMNTEDFTSKFEKSIEIKDDFNEVKIENNSELRADLEAINLTSVRSVVTAINSIRETTQDTSIKAVHVQSMQNEKVDTIIEKESVNSKDKEPSTAKEKEEQQNTNTFENKVLNNQTVYESNQITINNNGIEKVISEKDRKSVTKDFSSQIKNMEDLEEEDIIILKGKVSRIISRLDSREQHINKTDIDDLPTNVSVTSKIANFEKSDSSNSIHENKTYNSDPKPNTTLGDKPKIVDEILKAPEILDINHNEQNSITKTEIIHDTEVNNNTKDLINKFDKKSSNDDPYDKNSKFKSDYYSIYNKVHSSIVNRLNSIEMKFKSGEIQKTEFQNETPNIPYNIYEIEIDNNLKETKSESESNISNKIHNPFDEVFASKKDVPKVDMYKEYRAKRDPDIDKRAKSVAELDIGDAVKGRVRQMVYRMNSMERMRMLMRSETVDRKERLRKVSITDRVALFEKKVIPICSEETTHRTTTKATTAPSTTFTDEEIQEKIADLANAKNKYGKWKNMTTIELRDGSSMPVLAVGTALLEPRLVKHIVSAAIDLGYRAIDTAFIYGNEKQVGEAIRAKIEDGTVTREELFIISKLWSTFHRRDLVMKACKQSLETMGLDYFDLYLIHNPMSFKEGNNPIPKIANVLQYSEHDYMDAWYGIEDVIRKGLVKRGGVSNFNSVQVERVVDKGKIKPVINQVECHPYLIQERLHDFCLIRHVKLSCFGVLGSKGTPLELKSNLPPAMDDPLVKVMSAGLGVTPAQLLIAYQLQAGRNVVVKSSSAHNLWNNLQALSVKLDQSQVSALNALNRNKRIFTFSGMGDTHRNYPFKIAF